jgi:hypothetical protein
VNERALCVLVGVVVAALVVGWLVRGQWLGSVRLREWARREKFTLIRSRQLLFAWRFVLTGGWPVFRIEVLDEQGRTRTGIVRFGTMPVGTYSDFVQVVWD